MSNIFNYLLNVDSIICLVLIVFYCLIVYETLRDETFEDTKGVVDTVNRGNPCAPEGFAVPVSQVFLLIKI